MRSRSVIVAAALAVVMWPTIAGAQTVAVIDIQGAAEVDGPPDCASSSRDDRVTHRCTVVLCPGGFGCDHTWELTPTVWAAPADHWKFDRWEGCREVRGTVCVVDSQTFAGFVVKVVYDDDTPPTVTLNEVDTQATDRTATVRFSTNEPATFTCELDGATAAPCTSPLVRGGLIEGSHVVSVRAQDASENETGPVHQSFTIVDTALTGGPAPLTTSARTTFQFSSAAATSFQCSYDSQAFAPCTSPHSVTAADGDHTFAVRAHAGPWRDPVPAIHTWRVDTTIPETTLTGTIAERDDLVETTSRRERFQFSASEPASFECSVDGAPFRTCTSPVDLSRLAQGAHSFQVRARDVAGHVEQTPAERRWTVVPLGSRVLGTLRAHGTYDTFRTLYVQRAIAGSRVQLRCLRRCEFARKRITVRRALRRLPLTRHVRPLRLPRGSVFEVRVTRRPAIGVIRRWRFRSLANPRTVELCLPPGERPRRCPS
jgi:hypothetical protein